MALAPEHIPYFFAAGLMLVLAAVLLRLNFNSRPNRSFALYLVLRGMSLLTFGLGFTADTAADARYWYALYPYFLIPLPLVVLHFILVYPTPRLAPGARRLAGPALALVALVLEGLYVADHGAFWDVSTLPLGENPIFASAPKGLLFLTFGLGFAAFAVAGLVFARDALRAPPTPARTSLFLVSLGFAVVALFESVNDVVGPRGVTNTMLLREGALPVTLITAALLAARGLPSPDPGLRSASRRYLAALALPVLSALLVTLSSGGADRLSTGPGFFFVGLWRLVLPALVVYALLRHQLFGIDLKVKWSIRQGTVAAAFVGLFFVVSEGAQEVFSESIGPMMGIAAAGMLVFAMAPLQRAAERVANAAMPEVRSAEQLVPSERRDLYLAWVRAAWADGVMRPKERAMLDVARAKLGLSFEEAARLESEALPRAGAGEASRAPRRLRSP